MHKVNESTQNKYSKKSSMIALKAYHCKVCWPWPSLRCNKKNNYTNTMNAMIMSGINGLNVHCVQCERLWSLCIFSTFIFCGFVFIHLCVWIMQTHDILCVGCMSLSWLYYTVDFGFCSYKTSYAISHWKFEAWALFTIYAYTIYNSTVFFYSM